MAKENPINPIAGEGYKKQSLPGERVSSLSQSMAMPDAQVGGLGAKSRRNRSGFTLLEVLIATVVLAIALSGLYAIIKINITTSGFIKSKIELYAKGSELFYTLYSSQKEIEPTGTYLNYDDRSGIKYRIEKKPIGYLDINEVTIYLKKDGSEIVYRFYK